MSRYLLRMDETHEVVVGYDSPLDTFFAQVYDVVAGNALDDDVLILWSGRTPNEVTDAGVLIESVREWVSEVDIANAIKEYGYGDGKQSLTDLLNLDRGARRQPTEFQRDTFKRLTGGDLP